MAAEKLHRDLGRRVVVVEQGGRRRAVAIAEKQEPNGRAVRNGGVKPRQPLAPLARLGEVDDAHEWREPEPEFSVVITTHKRPDMLWRAFKSCLDAGVHHIVVVATGVDDAARKVLGDIKGALPSATIIAWEVDPGSNVAWLEGVEATWTPWVVLLHDDDVLLPGFREVVPRLGTGVDFVSWDATKHGNGDGLYKTWDLPEGRQNAKMILGKELTQGWLTISPVCGAFRRGLLIRAFREFEQLRRPRWRVRGGLDVGNDLWLWLRAAELGQEFWYHAKPCVSYGAHEGSATEHFGLEGLSPIYDEVRAVWAARAPRFVHCVETEPKKDAGMQRRQRQAMASWRAIEGGQLYLPVYVSEFGRDSRSVGDHRGCPFLRDILAAGLGAARPDDAVILTNDDTILPKDILWRVWGHLQRESACSAFRTNFDESGKQWVDGGRDLFAWWGWYLQEMFEEIPDFVMGSNHWDTVLALRERIVRNIPQVHDLHGRRHPRCELPRDSVFHEWHSAYAMRPENKVRSPAQMHNHRRFAAWLDANGMRFLQEWIPDWNELKVELD